MASNEILISNLSVAVAESQLRELCSRFLTGTNAGAYPAQVGSITIAAVSDPNRFITTAVIECPDDATAASIVAGLTAQAAPFHGRVITAVQGS